MTTGQSGDSPGGGPDQGADATEVAPRTTLEANLALIEGLTQRLVASITNKRDVPKALQGPSQEIYLKAASAWMAEALADPAKMIQSQTEHWGKAMEHFIEAQKAMASGLIRAPDDPGPTDRRFKNPLWDTHPWFNFVKRRYLINAEAIAKQVAGIEGLDARTKRRLDYFSRQMVDMMAPTNFLATNPDALEQAVATEGQSLVDGLTNLVRDLEAGGGELVVRLADEAAFRVGGNLATTPGAVVFRNHLFELIQYAPSTPEVRRIPLLIFPPWINKFYILDLTERNSLIRWIVDQGYTVFVVSWVNPDASYRDTSMTDYVEEGFLTAIREVRAICGTKRVNAVGYCIAGTTLALTLGVMRKRRDRSIASATFLTTLTDFSDQGEVGVFLDDDFIDGIEEESRRTGILDRFYMARTFSYLRSNDLIYQPAIKAYMMGQRPPAFDLLYWNGDSTNLPATMAVEYLRGLCQEDRFAKDGFAVAGEVVRLRDVRVPLCAIACETDHIAAWTSSWRGIKAMASQDKTFILSESGHIAGIVNPPSKVKYGHWINAETEATPEEWKGRAAKHAGSWWPRWEEWLRARSGRLVAARVPGEDGRAVLAAAPGTYVLPPETV